MAQFVTPLTINSWKSTTLFVQILLAQARLLDEQSPLSIQDSPSNEEPCSARTWPGALITPNKSVILFPPVVAEPLNIIIARTKTTTAIIPNTIIVQTGVSPRLFIIIFE